MNLYWIFFFGFALLVIFAVMGYFYFVNWLDQRIDKRDRLGKDSVVKKNVQERNENGDTRIEKFD